MSHMTYFFDSNDKRPIRKIIEPRSICFFSWQTRACLAHENIQVPIFFMQLLDHAIVPAKVLHDQVEQGIH